MTHNFLRSSNLMIVVLIFGFFALSSCSKKGGNPTPQPPSNSITSLSVNKGPYTTSVTITGIGFSDTSANDHVFFNGKEAVITYATTTQLIATVPLAAGTGNVTVKLKNGTVVTGPVFTYQPALVVTTLAGSGVVGFKDGVGTAASFNEPAGIAVDGSGNLYVADELNRAIRKITPDGTVSTLAGNGTIGHADGTGTAATFFNPAGIALDPGGNIIVADYANNLIRKVTPSGVVTTIAGTAGFIGDKNGIGTAASFAGPTDLTVDANGNVFVADFANNMIREISPAGVVSTFAGAPGSGSTNGSGTSARFNFPIGITIDGTGNLYVSDLLNYEIRKIAPTGLVSTYAGTGTQGLANGAGSVASFQSPQYPIIDSNGNLYISDVYVIRKIDPTGVVSTFAGSGTKGSSDGLAANASLGSGGLAVDASGNIYFCDAGNVIRKVSIQ